MEGEKSTDMAISWEDVRKFKYFSRIEFNLKSKIIHIMHNLFPQDPLSGIIPRSLSHLFDELRLLQAEFTVRVSFLELYNEEIFDLLSPSDDATKLK